MKYIIRSGKVRGDGGYWYSASFGQVYWADARKHAKRFDTREEAEATLKRKWNGRIVRLLSLAEAKEKAANRAAAIATTIALNAPTSSGFRPHRYRDNPDEQRFAEAWARFAPDNLRYLIDTSDGHNQHMVRREEPRDRWVSERIIQWLGTPVGLGFLRELGFEKVEKRR